MEFATRDSYRHATEQAARRSTSSESEVAAKAVELARNRVDTTDPRTAHVGYYLIDEGLPALERAVGVRRSLLDTLRGFGRRHPLPIYLGTIVTITAALSVDLATRVYPWLVGSLDVASIALLALIILLFLLATSQLAVSIVNWLVTLLVKPRPLPRMDYSEGIPPSVRTLVAVPTLLTDAASAEKLIEALEVRFLANRDANLHFALLTDFPDADQETLPTDDALLQLARDGINALNRTYGDRNESPGDIFYLLHRPRRWNPQQRAWMGRERKRGKLGDLNALLRGHPGDAFSVIVGDTEPLSQVKYVITLDTDTQLPRESARQLVGAMAHPLNWPQFDRPRFEPTQAGSTDSNSPKRAPPRHAVTAGYGILQPRIAVSLPETRRSPYARLYSGEPGLDPYTRTVSDVYQDAFGEGSFIGKGIYDVDAFESALANRFPDNRILSHDLLEGCLARSGLLSDVQLYEQFPSRYSADVARRHRWIRGDWQLLGWLRRRVPLPDGRRVPNPMSWLSQWKIFDNLRRSLVPVVIAVAVAGRLGRVAASVAMDGGRLCCAAIACCRDCADRSAAQAARNADRTTPRGRRANRANTIHAIAACAGMAAVRSLLFCRRHRAHALAHADFAPAPARVETFERRRAPARREPQHRSGGGLSNDVDRPDDRSADVDRDAGDERLGVAHCRADSAAVARIARARVVDQPAARAAQRRPFSSSGEISAPACAQDVGIF